MLELDSQAPARRRLLVVSALVLGAAFLSIGVFSQRDSLVAPSEDPEAASVLEVLPVRVVLEPGYAVSERFVGRVTSRRSSALGFTAGGLLVDVAADEGEGVSQGQVLARLDRAEREATRRELEAQAAETRARLGLARLTLERTRRLVGQDSVSEQQYDEARFEVQALEARRASVAAAIERVDVQLERTELRAPYDGRIVARSADEGTILAPGQEVVRLIESGPMEVRVGVSPEVAAGFDRSLGHTVEIDGTLWPARVVAVLDEVAPETRTVTVILEVDPGDVAIRHGALARLFVASHRGAEGFWVPITALTESRRGLWAAFALAPVPDHPGHHRLERRELTLLHVESDRAFVRGTLRDGEQIAASGLHRLVPGQTVAVADPQRLAQGDRADRAAR